MTLPTKMFIGFAAVGYLETLGLYFAPAHLSLNPLVLLGLCPACFLTTVVHVPPLASVWLILAPLDGLAYGIFGVGIGLILTVAD